MCVCVMDDRKEGRREGEMERGGEGGRGREGEGGREGGREGEEEEREYSTCTCILCTKVGKFLHC